MDGAVRDYLESMTFLPGDVDGKAVDTKVTVPVVFKLTAYELTWVSR
jgi:hypothetical protein